VVYFFAKIQIFLQKYKYFCIIHWGGRNNDVREREKKNKEKKRERKREIMDGILSG